MADFNLGNIFFNVKASIEEFVNPLEQARRKAEEMLHELQNKKVQIPGLSSFAQELKQNLQKANAETNSFLQKAKVGFGTFANYLKKVGIAAGQNFARTLVTNVKIAVNNVKAQFEHLKLTLQRFSGVLAGLGFVGGGFLFADMIKNTVAFEQELAQVSTMLDENTMKYMKEYEAGLNHLAGQFGQTTQALTKGLYDILSATIPASNALDVLKASAIGAAAGLTSIDKAVSVTLTILKSYGLEASKAAEVQDWLFNVVKKGRVTYDDLAASLGRVLSVAKTVGASLDEVGAMITVMTKAGLNIHETVTSIAAIFNSLLAPSEQARKVIKELGLEIDLYAVKTQGLIGILKQLQGLPADVIQTIFPNRRALRGILPLLNNMNEYLKDYQFIMTNVGSAYEAFQKNTNTTEFRLKQFKATLYSTGRQLLSSFLPSLTKLTNGLVLLLNIFQKIPIEVSVAVTAFWKLSRAMQRMGLVHLLPNWKEFIHLLQYGGKIVIALGGIFRQFIAGIVAMNAATIRSALSFETLKKVLLGLQIAFKAFNPMLLIVTAGLTALILNFDKVKKTGMATLAFLKKFGENVSALGTHLASGIAALFTLDIAQAKEHFGKLKEVFVKGISDATEEAFKKSREIQAQEEAKTLKSAEDVVSKMKGIMYQISDLYTSTFVKELKGMRDNPTIQRILEQFKNMVVNIRLGFITDKSEALDKLQQIQDMLGQYKVHIKEVFEIGFINEDEFKKKMEEVDKLKEKIIHLRDVIKFAEVGKGKVFETDDRQLLAIKRTTEAIKTLVNQLGQMNAKAEELGKSLRSTFVDSLKRLGMDSKKAERYIGDLFEVIAKKGLSGKEVLEQIENKLLEMGYNAQQIKDLTSHMVEGFKVVFRKGFYELLEKTRKEFESGEISIIKYKNRLENLAKTSKEYGKALVGFYITVKDELDKVNEDIAKERQKAIEKIEKDLAQLAGSSFEIQLKEIEKTAEYWKALGVNEVKIKEWVEAQKLRITKDRINQELEAEQDRLNRTIALLSSELEFKRNMAKLKGEYTPEFEEGLLKDYEASIQKEIKMEEDKAKKILENESLSKEERLKIQKEYFNKAIELRMTLYKKELEWGRISKEEFVKKINEQILNNKNLTLSEEERVRVYNTVNQVLEDLSKTQEKANKKTENSVAVIKKAKDEMKKYADTIEETAKRLGTLDAPKIEGLDDVFKIGDIVKDEFGNLIKVLEVDEKGAITKFENVAKDAAGKVIEESGTIVQKAASMFGEIAKKGFDAINNTADGIANMISSWTDNFKKSLTLSLSALKQYYEAKAKLRIMDMIEEAKIQMLKEKAEEKARRAQMAFMEKYAGHNRIAELIMTKGLELAFQRIQAKWQAYMSVLNKSLGNVRNINIPALVGNNGTSIRNNYNIEINVSEGVTNKDVIKKVVKEGIDEVMGEFPQEYNRFTFGGVEL